MGRDGGGAVTVDLHQLINDLRSLDAGPGDYDDQIDTAEAGALLAEIDRLRDELDVPTCPYCRCVVAGMLSGCARDECRSLEIAAEHQLDLAVDP